MSDTPDLTALVASKLIHDLIGPLGAVGNGIELLEMIHPPSDELDLLRESAQAAQTRLRLYRLAFGAASQGALVSGPDLSGLIADSDGRITRTADLPEQMPRAVVRLGLLGMLCAEMTLAWGGALHMTLTGDHWRIDATAPRLKLEDRLWQALAAGQTPPEMTAAEVSFALLARALPVAPMIEALPLDGEQRLSLSF